MFTQKDLYDIAKQINNWDMKPSSFIMRPDVWDQIQKYTKIEKFIIIYKAVLNYKYNILSDKYNEDSYKITLLDRLGLFERDTIILNAGSNE
jgi:hypothetical protein